MSETAFEKLDRFSAYESGWRFGEGEPFHGAVITGAKDIVELYQADHELDVFPVPDGSIVITVYNLNGVDLDFRINIE